MDSKNLAKFAASKPSPILFKGCSLDIESILFKFCNKNVDIFDFVKLGAIQFTLVCGASSAARATVKPSTAAFAGEIIL